MIKNKQIIGNLISYLSLLNIFILVGFSFSNTRYSNKTAEFSVFDSICQSDGAEYYFANISVPGEAKEKVHEKIFFSNYSKNFSGTSTRMLTVSGPDGLESFKTCFNDIELPFLTNPVSGINYSNSEEECRLETVDINIYKYLPRKIEHSFDKDIYDGFIYIPDFYADYIIENSESLNTYDDLIDNVDCNTLSLHYRSRVFSYKIANIFHVNGFKDNYSTQNTKRHNDFNNGKKINCLLDGYAFVSNYDHFTLFDDQFYTTFILQIGSKKFELEENLLIADSFNAQKNEINTKAELFYYGNNGIQKYNNSLALTNSLFLQNENSINLVLFSIAVGLLNVFIFVSLLNLANFLGFKRDKNYFQNTSIICLIFLVIHFLAKTIAPTNSSVYKYFNPYLSILSVAILIISLICYVWIVVKQHV